MSRQQRIDVLIAGPVPLVLLTAAVATVKEPVPYEPFSTKKSRWRAEAKRFVGS